MKNDLLENIEKLHTTPMGVDRIRRNLSLGDDVKDVVEWLKFINDDGNNFAFPTIIEAEE